jgi:hypothetical protein
MSKKRSPLLPDRHPIQDFFVCEITDAIPKDDVASMEHPVFSLATNPDLSLREYENNGSKISIVPSGMGLATIHDKDILIYCISQLIAKMNEDKDLVPSKTLHLKAHDLLVSTNRSTDGRGYEQLKDALTRLRGTTIRTNITTNDTEVSEGFGLIESWKVHKENGKGRMSELRITLSDWIYNAVVSKEVLTLPREYFRLRKPLERRMYELARKHCGKQNEWLISLKKLKKKCGSISDDYEFKRLVNTICSQDALHNHMPDYSVAVEGENVRFKNRLAVAPALPASTSINYPRLTMEAYIDAKTVAPGYDIYWLESEWKKFWLDSGQEDLRNPDAAFIGFCKRRYERNPNP